MGQFLGLRKNENYSSLVPEYAIVNLQSEGASSLTKRIKPSRMACEVSSLGKKILPSNFPQYFD